MAKFNTQHGSGKDDVSGFEALLSTHGLDEAAKGNGRHESQSECENVRYCLLEAASTHLASNGQPERRGAEDIVQALYS
jgi:hypothetical protein